MSEAETIHPDAEETAVTEPPRIPLRIWHWFVWMFATMVLMAVVDARGTTVSDFTDRAIVAIMVIWSARSGLILTASSALWHIVRREQLPREVRWCPGHFLVWLGLVSTVVQAAIYISDRFVTFSPSFSRLYTKVTWVEVVILVAIAALAFRGATARRWKLFFLGWIVVSALHPIFSYFWGYYDAFQTISVLFIATDAICIMLLINAMVGDLVRRPRVVYSRTWTHWAGVLATFVSLVTQLGWHVVNSPFLW